jgi:type I restriction-modification system DNA methylase subunit
MINKDKGRELVKELVERFRKERDNLIRVNYNYNETKLRNDFLNHFLIALGWDVFNENGAPQYLRDVVHEDVIEVKGDEEGELLSKKPDYALRAGGERKLFVEAKKPAVRIESHKPSAFQIRRYGWSAGLSVSVLTNFDKLIIYDCRPIPKSDDDPRIARIREYDFSEYTEKFDEIFDQISCAAVYSGKFDEVFGETNDYPGQTFDQYFLQQIEKWRTAFAIDLLTHNSGLSEDELNFLVQRLINRILFLRICEDRALEKAKALKGVKTYEELKNIFLKADERYNSGLFDFIEDKLSLTIDVGSDTLVSIFKELYYPESPYNFSVVESSLLGEVYELFLAKTVQLDAREGVKVVEKPEIRESGGVVSTPLYIVDVIIKRALEPLCEGKSPSELSTLRIADISCGSGSFVVGAYEYLQRYHMDWYLKDGPEKHTEQIYKGKNNEWHLTMPEKKRILLNNIYGVDIDIQAVEVTRFSLLLKVLEDTTIGEVDHYLKQFKVQALPKLSDNIQCGNSLVDNSYFNFQEAADPEDVAIINPFDWQDAFPKIVNEGGFDLLIGNPPYIRIQNMVKYSPQEVEYYQNQGSPYVTAKSDNFDKYNLFIERALSLLKPNGGLCYIIPHKFSIIRAGRSLRALIAEGQHLSAYIDFGVHQVFGKRVTTYVCILQLSKSVVSQFTVEKVLNLNTWRYGKPGVITSHSASDISAEPWHFANAAVTSLFERIRSLPVANLGEVAEIFVGLQTSADKIYIFRPTSEDADYVEFVDRSGNTNRIERGILRPGLYKVHFSDFHSPEANSYMIFPYKITEDKADLYTLSEMRKNYPNALDYLLTHKDTLLKRNVPNMTEDNWYQFGRSQSLTKFNGEPKLIWSTLLHEPRYVYDDKNVVFTGGGNGPYYGLRMKENSPLSLFYIQAILHHPVIDAMVSGSAFAGNYVSHGKQYVANLPIRLIDFNNSKEVNLYQGIIKRMVLLNKLTLEAEEATTPQKRDIYSRMIVALKREIFTPIERLYEITKADIDAVRENNE